MTSTRAERWKRLLRKVRRAILRDEPTYYDMFENQGERYFGRLYLHQINRMLEQYRLAPPLNILDAGCQAGRLAIPLSLAGHRLTGVDTSYVALRRARRHARKNETSLQLVRADLGRWLPRQPSGCFDVVLCAEVLYLRKNYRALLEGLVRVLRPGGLCFIAHRPTAYYLAEAFQRKDLDAARLVLNSREGILWGSYYNWQDPVELKALYFRLKIDPMAITSIGLLSWLAVNPEELQETDRDLLFELEAGSQGRGRGGGRYLLVCGRKR